MAYLKTQNGTTGKLHFPPMCDIIRVRPIPVSGIGRYSPILVSIGIIGANTRTPVVRLPVSTVNTVATHTYSFKPIPYFRAYTPHTYITCTLLYPHKIAFSVQKNLYSSVSVQLRPIVSVIGYQTPARYRSNHRHNQLLTYV